MKRFASFLLSIFVIFCLAHQVSAEALPSDFSLDDLSSFGIESLKLSRSITPTIDGVISEGEYTATDWIYQGKGLCFTADGVVNNEHLDAKQKNYVALYGSFLVLAMEAQLPRNLVNAYDYNGSGPVYAVSFTLGLTPGNHPKLRASVWNQNYYFSAEDFDCAGVSGMRLVSSVEGPSRVALQLSTFRPSLSKNGFTDENGILWDGKRFSEYAAFSLVEKEDRVYAACEVMIPLEDALLSVPDEQKSTVRNSVLANQGTLCGGFSASLSFSEMCTLVSGIPTEAPYPDASGQTWGDALSFCYSDGEETYGLKVIPIPLYLAGNAPAKDSAENRVPVFETDSKSEDKDSFVDAPSKFLSLTPNVPTVSSSVLLEDESVFDCLPDEGDAIPEESEILPIEKEEEEKKSTSLLGSVFTVLSGLLLLSAVIILCIYDRKREKREEEEEKKLLKKKKSTQKNKKG